MKFFYDITFWSKVKVGLNGPRGAVNNFFQEVFMKQCFSKFIVMLCIVYGFLDAAAITGVVTDSLTGEKLDNARVQLRSGNRTTVTDTTDEEGKFVFSDVDTGSYTIRVSRSGYTTKSVDIEVSADDITIDIPLTAVIQTTVSGTVTDSADGTVLPGAVVQLRSGNRTIATDTTGSDGKFSFADIQTGDYTVRTSLQGYITKSINITATGTEPVEVNIPLVEAAKVTIEGKVTDTATGSALGNAVVQLRSGNSLIAADTTGEDGSFFFANVEEGNLTLRVSLSGYRTKTVNISVSAGRVEPLNIYIAKIVVKNVAVIVKKSADSTALSGASVVTTTAGGALLVVVADAEGKAIFENLDEGTYTFSASAEGFTPRAIRYTLNASSTDSVVLFLSAAEGETGSISGKVTDSLTGGAIKGAEISLRITTGGGGAGGSTVTLAAFTDENGSFTIGGIPARVLSASISATAEGYRTVTRNITLDTSGTTEVNIKMIERPSDVSQPHYVPLTAASINFRIDHSRNGVITINNLQKTAKIQLFSIDGRIVFSRKYNKEETRSPISLRVNTAYRSVVLRISGEEGNVLFSRLIKMAR